MKIDKTPPNFTEEISTSNIGGNSFSIKTKAEDALSGAGGKITYKCTVTEENGINKKNLGENRNGSFTAVGLQPNTKHNIEITAKDQAGNETTKTGECTTTDGSSSGGNQGGNGTGGNGSGNPGGNQNGNGDGNNNGNQGGNGNGQGGNGIDQNLIDPGPDDGYEDQGPLQRPKIGIIQLEGCELYNGKYYKGGIQVVIEDAAPSNISTAKTLHYQILDKTGQDVTESASGGTKGEASVPYVTFNMINDGTYTIVAKAKDGEGNYSLTRERQVVIDQVAPSIPQMQVSGTHGPNTTDESYVGVVTVAITPGIDATSGTWGIKYYIKGANRIKETSIKTTSTYTVSITTIGESTVYAKTIDNAGHESEYINTAPIERVATSTETGSKTIDFKVTATNTDHIVVVVNFTGATIGISSYEFKIGTTSTNLQTIEIRETDSRRYDYTYRKINATTNLAANTTYYMQVVAHDADGEAVESPVRSAKTSYNQYVQPINPTDTTRTGMTVDYMPEETAGWAIWGEDENYLYLVSRDAKTVSLSTSQSQATQLMTLDLAAQNYVSNNYVRCNFKVD